MWWGSPGGAAVKNLPVNAGDARDTASIRGSGRSPGERNGNPPQYLAWKVPWTEEPDGLWSTGLQRVRCHWTSEHTHRQCDRLSLHSQISSLNIIQFSSVTQLCMNLCDFMDCSPPGLPVHNQLLEPTQTHVHCVSDAFQPSHPLLSPSPPAFNLSQHQGLFQWVSFLYQVAKVLEFQLQHQFFQWILRTDFL